MTFFFDFLFNFSKETPVKNANFVTYRLEENGKEFVRFKYFASANDTKSFRYEVHYYE